MLALIALYPRRLSLLPTLGLAAVAGAVLIYAAGQRDALANGLNDATAHSQGDDMVLIALAVCGAAALLQIYAVRRAEQRIQTWPQISRRTAVRVFGVTALVAVVLAVIAGGPEFASDRWQEFKNPHGALNRTSVRYSSASGNGRYQLWQSAVDENATDPLIGTGPGTFQYWWAAQRNPSRVRPQRAFALFRDAGRARHRRLCAHPRGGTGADRSRHSKSPAGGRRTPRRSGRRRCGVRGVRDRRGERLGMADRGDTRRLPAPRRGHARQPA